MAYIVMYRKINVSSFGSVGHAIYVTKVIMEIQKWINNALDKEIKTNQSCYIYLELYFSDYIFSSHILYLPPFYKYKILQMSHRQ